MSRGDRVPRRGVPGTAEIRSPEPRDSASVPSTVRVGERTLTRVSGTRPDVMSTSRAPGPSRRSLWVALSCAVDDYPVGCLAVRDCVQQGRPEPVLSTVTV